MIRLKEFTGQSLHSFRRTWIISGIVSEHKLGNRRLITKLDLNKIKDIWKENKTPAYIGKKLGRDSSLCINLEKMGLLKPTLVIGKKSKRIKFYPAYHPIYQKYMK